MDMSEMKIIPTAEHPSNLDPTARIVWENRAALATVYRVKGGFVATVGVGAYNTVFSTQGDAVKAIETACRPFD